MPEAISRRTHDHLVEYHVLGRVAVRIVEATGQQTKLVDKCLRIVVADDASALGCHVALQRRADIDQVIENMQIAIMADLRLQNDRIQ